MRLGSIYSLSDPDTELVRYIGQTIVIPKRRYDQHIYQWKRCHGGMTHLNSWIKHLSSKGLKPILNVEVSDISESELDTRETEVIRLLKACGADLCNHTIGGGGSRGYKHTEESKQKRLKSLSISVAWKEKHIRHSQIMKEKYRSGELLPPGKRIPLDKRLEINQKIAEGHGTRRLLKIREISTGNILNFNGIYDFSNYIGFKSPSSVRDFLYSKRKSHLINKYQVLENKSKSELQAAGKLKEKKAKEKKKK